MAHGVHLGLALDLRNAPQRIGRILFHRWHLSYPIWWICTWNTTLKLFLLKGRFNRIPRTPENISLGTTSAVQMLMAIKKWHLRHIHKLNTCTHVLWTISPTISCDDVPGPRCALRGWNEIWQRRKLPVAWSISCMISQHTEGSNALWETTPASVSSTNTCIIMKHGSTKSCPSSMITPNYQPTWVKSWMALMWWPTLQAAWHSCPWQPLTYRPYKQL